MTTQSQSQTPLKGCALARSRARHPLKQTRPFKALAPDRHTDLNTFAYHARRADYQKCMRILLFELIIIFMAGS